MKQYRFDPTWTPPAPIVRAVVQRPGLSIATGEFPALIDTGADYTVLPGEVVDELHLIELDVVSIESFGGYETECPAYDVQVRLVGEPRIVDVLALASDTIDYVILGRDILKHFLVTIDGPNGVFIIS